MSLIPARSVQFFRFCSLSAVRTDSPWRAPCPMLSSPPARSDSTKVRERCSFPLSRHAVLSRRRWKPCSEGGSEFPLSALSLEFRTPHSEIRILLALPSSIYDLPISRRTNPPWWAPPSRPLPAPDRSLPTLQLRRHDTRCLLQRMHGTKPACLIQSDLSRTPLVQIEQPRLL